MVNQKVKDGAVIVGVSAVYSCLASVAASLGFILVGRQFLSPKVSLDTLIQINFNSLFIIFFIFSFFIVLTFQIILARKEPDPAQFNPFGLGDKLRKLSLYKRQRITVFLRWNIAFSFIIVIVLFLLIGQETWVNPSYKSPLLNWFLILYFVVLLMLPIRKFIMNQNDWAVYHLENYKKASKCKDLEKTLGSYNKILGSTLSPKTLVALSQYVEEAFKIGNDDEIKQLNAQIEKTMSNLRNKEVPEIDKDLIELSVLAKKMTEEHERILGFEPKYPLRILLDEKLRSSTDKVFPQIILFLVWIGLFLVLARFGIINITLPP